MIACSVASAAEPLGATAPFATTWLVVEHPGPWSSDALQSASLDRALAAHLQGFVGDGVRVLLARHADRPTRSIATSRRVWLARTGTRHAELLSAAFDDLGVILGWTSAELREGSVAELVPDVGHPLVLVCTNGRRDACCAVEGRALMSALLEEAGTDRGRIWECSHVGGHRFAPVTLTLPHGVVHGRIPVDDAASFWHRSRHHLVSVDHLRGITCHRPGAQAAEIAVRRLADATAIADLVVVDDADEAVVVAHRDGRRWRVRVTTVDLDLVRPQSCGAEPSSAHAWSAEPVELH